MDRTLERMPPDARRALVAGAGAAIDDETARFTAALVAGASVRYTPGWQNPHRVIGATADTLVCVRESDGADVTLPKGAWADLLRQAGVPRHPLFVR